MNGEAKKRIQPLVGHHVLAEFDVGVSFVELAAFGGVIKFGARHEPRLDARAFAENAAVFRGGLEGGEIDADRRQR